MPRDGRSHTDVPTMPSGTEIASYPTYLEASHGVDFLGESGFDLSTITIVGTDLHMVERVTGRLTAGKVALSGAGSGAMWGLMMGLMMSFAAQKPGNGIWIISGMIGGAIVGTIMLELWYLLEGNKRDFTSRSQVVASRYAVLASSEVNEAFRLLQTTAGNQIQPPRVKRSKSTGPTEYGSRVDERPRFGVRVDTDEQVGEPSTQRDDESSRPRPAFGAYSSERGQKSANGDAEFHSDLRQDDPVIEPLADPPSDPHNPWSVPSSLASSFRVRNPRQDQKGGENQDGQEEKKDPSSQEE